MKKTNDIFSIVIATIHVNEIFANIDCSDDFFDEGGFEEYRSLI